MKAIIFNSGMGTRMGDFTKTSPKCMTKISGSETIIKRQLIQLQSIGINDVVVTTGPFEEKLISYCKEVAPKVNFTFVNNCDYKTTNYIYSMYLAKDELDDDIVLMHGDLVFENSVIADIANSDKSQVVVSSTVELPEKDFKATFDKTTNCVSKIGIDVFENAIALQPLYFIKKDDMKIWLNEVTNFCNNGTKSVYAENAFNAVSNKCHIFIFDIKDRLCNEIDCVSDLNMVKERLQKI